MWEFLKTKDGAKALSMVLTSVGGLILAGFLVYFFVDLTKQTQLLAGNHIDHNTKAITELSSAVNRIADNQQQQALVLQGVKETNQQLIGFLQGVFNRK